MAKNMREPLAAKRVLLHITDVVASTTAAQFTGKPFVNFYNYWYSDRTGAYVDLGFVDDSLALTDLPFDASTYNFRLDHVASDFDLTFPSITTDKKSYLGSQDDIGTANSYLDEGEPDKATIKVTVSGKPTDLDKLMAGVVTTSPTGQTRYNFGSRPSVRFGFVVAVIDNPAAPESADNVSMIYFINNALITDGGNVKASGDGNYERTLTVECDAPDLWEDVADGQNTPAVINI